MQCAADDIDWALAVGGVLQSSCQPAAQPIVSGLLVNMGASMVSAAKVIGSLVVALLKSSEKESWLSDLSIGLADSRAMREHASFMAVRHVRPGETGGVRAPSIMVPKVIGAPGEGAPSRRDPALLKQLRVSL